MDQPKLSRGLKDRIDRMKSALIAAYGIEESRTIWQEERAPFRVEVAEDHAHGWLAHASVRIHADGRRDRPRREEYWFAYGRSAASAMRKLEAEVGLALETMIDRCRSGIKILDSDPSEFRRP